MLEEGSKRGPDLRFVDGREAPRVAALGRAEGRPHGAGAPPRRRPRHITLYEARSRLDRSRSWQVNSHFSAFFKIYKICIILRRSSLKIFENFVKKFVILKKLSQIFEIFEIRAAQNCENLVDLEKC